MNRAIKFRAWDFAIRAMVYSGFSIPNTGWRRAKGDEHFDLELMQFTNLKDKNGKEIYEGDIAIVDGRRTKVVWRNNQACFSFQWETDDHHFNSIDYDAEVIGNVYESPELLKA